MTLGVPDGSERIPLSELPWSEIRASWAKGSYADFYESNLQRGEGAPVQCLDVTRDESGKDAVRKQVEKARSAELARFLGIVDTSYVAPQDECHPLFRVYDAEGDRHFRINPSDPIKLWVESYEEPQLDPSDVLTRMYLGIDPRTATDAYFALVKQFHSRGLLGKFDSCLYRAILREGLISTNMIVLYVYKSQAKTGLLDEILTAYRETKKQNPSQYELTSEQRDRLLLSQLGSFRCAIDQNLTFVEVSGDDPWKVTSWDGWGDVNLGGAQQLYRYLGISSQRGDHQERMSVIQLLREREKNGGVLNNQAMKTVADIREGRRALHKGERITLGYKRRWNCPALVTNGQSEYVMHNGRLVYVQSQ